MMSSTKKLLARLALAAGALTLSVASHAELGTSAFDPPPAQPHIGVQPAAADPLAPALPAPTATDDAEQLQTLAVADARAFLKTAAAAGWRAVEVTAPRCVLPRAKKGHPVTRKIRLACQAVNRECSVAQNFARQHGLHARCGTLYHHSTVLLTNQR
jgi:hypothetical protein